MKNIHPVDELSDIRNELQRLRNREDEVRKMILQGECGLIGDFHEARIKPRTRRSLPIRKVERLMGVDWVDEHSEEVSFSVIAITENGGGDG